MLFAQATWEPLGHYPERGDEWKTSEGTEITRHGFKLHHILRRCGHILSNPSLPAAISVVSKQSVGGKSLNQGTPSLLHSARR